MSKKILLGLLMISIFGACGRKSKNSSNGGKFEYNEKKGRCLSGDAEGYNDGVIGECGLIKGANLSKQDFSGQSFRGMRFEKVDATEANFSGADFTGAFLLESDFDQANLSGADLSFSYVEDTSIDGADLRGTMFYRVQDDRATGINLKSSSLKGSKINSRTTMDGDVTDNINKFELIYDGMDNPAGLNLTGDTAAIGLVREGKNSLSTIEQARVVGDVREFEKLKFDAKNQWFGKIFKGNDAASVLRYLNERVHHVAHIATNSSDDKLVNAFNIDVNWWVKIYNDNLTSLNASSSRSYSPKKLHDVTLGSKVMVIDRPGLGIMSVAKGYNSMRSNWVSRVSTLAHEARHSDCAKAPAAEDVVKFMIDGSTDVSDDAKACNHLHIECPKGHDLAGQPACDAHAWGAYAVGAIMATAIAHDCPDCAEEDIQAALAKEMDSKSRIMVLENMLSGAAGEPNMGSLR